RRAAADRAEHARGQRDRACDPRPATRARRDRVPALRERLPRVRIARGLRGRDRRAARRPRPDRGANPMYDLLFRGVLKRLDPELAHKLGMVVIRAAGTRAIAPIVSRLTAPDPSLAVEALGRTFPSPFGVAAGFDKNAVGVRGLEALGFGHVEIGTVTAIPQPGNDRPRLFRLVADRGLINR